MEVVMHGNKAVFYIGGCSGSANPNFARPTFGHHTTAFGVVAGEEGVFIDNGSGVSKVASFLLGRSVKRVVGLQTHYHHDHVSGMAGNGLLFKPGLVERFYAPRLCRRSFRNMFRSYFSREAWPIAPGEQIARDVIEDFVPGSTLKSTLPVETLLQNHPGDPEGSVAYRIRTGTGDVVISTDSEPTGVHAERLAQFVSGSALFYADVQYRNMEYEGADGIDGTPRVSRKGWGHGTPQMVYEMLRHCPIPPTRIIVGHHDPARTEADLVQFEREVRHYLAPFDSTVSLAREGEAIEV